MRRFLCAHASSNRRSVRYSPVASPPQWRMRNSLCPPSLVRLKWLLVLSKGTPQEINVWMSSFASVTNMRTASSSHSPAPAVRVSAMCFFGIVVVRALLHHRGDAALGIHRVALLAAQLV